MDWENLFPTSFNQLNGTILVENFEDSNFQKKSTKQPFFYDKLLSYDRKFEWPLSIHSSNFVFHSQIKYFFSVQKNREKYIDTQKRHEICIKCIRNAIETRSNVLLHSRTLKSCVIQNRLKVFFLGRFMAIEIMRKNVNYTQFHSLPTPKRWSTTS